MKKPSRRTKLMLLLVLLGAAGFVVCKSRVWEQLFYRYEYSEEKVEYRTTNGEKEHWTHRERRPFDRWSGERVVSETFCLETGFMVVRDFVPPYYSTEFWDEYGKGAFVERGAGFTRKGEKPADQDKPTAPSWVYDDSLFETDGAK